MSTIYVFQHEVSAIDSVVTADRFLVWDASTGRTAYATAAQVAAGAGGLLVGPTVTGGATFSGTASVSYLFGSTLSSRLGFWGATGTSAATTIAAVATTVTATGSGVGFPSTAAVGSIITQINAIITALKDCGIVKT